MAAGEHPDDVPEATPPRDDAPTAPAETTPADHAGDDEDADADRARPLGSRAQRGARLAGLSATAGAGYVGSRLRGLTAGPEAESELHAATAERVVAMLGSMKGAAMKVGQMASFVDVDLPPEIRQAYQDVLAGLRSAAPPVDPDAIAAVIAEDFGAGPDEVFAHWEREPLASASIGQVHRARLHDGTRVVTKVQYPGVAEAVEADLENAASFAPLARVVSPHLDVDALVEEMRERLRDELDYQREARYQQAFRDRYEGHPAIAVPRVHHDWCRPRVLVVDEVQGRSFDAIAAEGDQATRDRLGELLFRFVFGSLHRFRLFHGDPHPGNYLLADDGRLWVLDFGSVKVFPRWARDGLEDVIRAVVAGDRDALVESMRRAGFVPEGAELDWDRLERWFGALHRPILRDEPFTYTSEYATWVMRETTDLRDGAVDALRRLSLPADYLLLNRVLLGVNSLLGRLRCTANWHRIAGELRGDGPPATALGEAEADFLRDHTMRA